MSDNVVLAETMSRVIGIIAAALDDAGVLSRDNFARHLDATKDGCTSETSVAVLTGMVQAIRTRPALTVHDGGRK